MIHEQINPFIGLADGPDFGLTDVVISSEQSAQSFLAKTPLADELAQFLATGTDLSFFEDVWIATENPMALGVKLPVGFAVFLESKFWGAPNDSKLPVTITNGEETVWFRRFHETAFSLVLTYDSEPIGVLSFIPLTHQRLLCVQIQGVKKIIQRVHHEDQVLAEDRLPPSSITPAGIQALSKLQPNGTPCTWQMLLFEAFLIFNRAHNYTPLMLSARINPNVTCGLLDRARAERVYDRTAMRFGFVDHGLGIFAPTDKLSVGETEND